MKQEELFAALICNYKGEVLFTEEHLDKDFPKWKRTVKAWNDDVVDDRKNLPTSKAIALWIMAQGELEDRVNVFIKGRNTSVPKSQSG